MSIDKADFFEFNFTTEERPESQATGGGGGGGKINPPDLTFTKYIDFSNNIDDLSAATGGGVSIGLLLPAVQAAREAAIPSTDTVFGEVPAFVVVQAWDDCFFG